MSQSLREIVAVAERILIEVCRTRRSMVFWIVFPTLMLLLFGLIYAGGGSTSTSFDHTAPGILIGAALFFLLLSQDLKKKPRLLSIVASGLTACRYGSRDPL